MRCRFSRSLVARHAAIAFVLLAASIPRAAAEEFDALFVMRPDGSQLKQLVKIDGYADLMAPRYSHDGKQIVVSARGQGGKRDCFVINADGTDVRNLVQARVAEWSPDGKQIVFKASTAPPIFAQNLDGSGRTEIGQGHSPSWSPDGGHLAVSDQKMVHLVDMVTGEERPVFEQPQENIFGGFAWSPDSKYLAVVARPAVGKRRELYLVDTLAEGLPRRLLAEGEMGGHLSFSPDGRKIVLADAVQIRIVDVAAQKRPRTVPGQQGHNRNPAWSPDGDTILFVGSTKE